MPNTKKSKPSTDLDTIARYGTKWVSRDKRRRQGQVLKVDSLGVCTQELARYGEHIDLRIVGRESEPTIQASAATFLRRYKQVDAGN